MSTNETDLVDCYPNFFPDLAVKDVDAALAWYKEVFEGEVVKRVPSFSNADKVIHSWISFKNGDGVALCNEDCGFDKYAMEFPDGKQTQVVLSIGWDKESAKEVFERAISKGAKLLVAFEKQFWGSIYGEFLDPFGHLWGFGEGKEPPTPGFPQVFVENAPKAIEWYVKHFKGQDAFRFPSEKNPEKLVHSWVKLANGVGFAVFDENAFSHNVLQLAKDKSPTTLTLTFPLEEAEALFSSSVGGGAKVLMPFEKQFWGETYGMMEDPFGIHWGIRVPGDKPAEKPEQKSEHADKKRKVDGEE